MADPPVAITVELLVNGTWQDISGDVYQRTPCQLTGGSPDEAKKPQHAQLTLTLDNRSGRYSPNYTGGDFYPYIVRDQGIRLSVTYTSSTGNFYSGYRFWGEVPNWPPMSDPSATDIFVAITASGILRRVRQGGGKGSALTRYYNQLTGNQAPIAYWPCEDDTDTTIIGAGIEGGQNMSVITGAPTWKAISNFNGSAPLPVINNSTWDGLTGSFNTSGDDSYTIPGTYTWVASTTSVDARCWGGGGGGGNGAGANVHAGGGGGEFAKEGALVVTPGVAYTVVVGSGGSGGAASSGGTPHAGSNGQSSVFAGDAVTVTAHGGKGGPLAGAGALGGTGSANTTHHDGGASGNEGGGGDGGGGGGGSGGTGATGNAGSNGSGNNGGAGGAAVTGGGKGGHGGNYPDNSAATPGASPGGGGGAGASSLASGGNGGGAGQTGGGGKVELIYTPTSGGTVANANILRFVLLVPAHGGNTGKVLIRALTTSTVLDHLDVTYVTGGKLRLQGFNAANVQQFDSGNESWNVDGRTVMVSVELAKSGANVAWKFKAVDPGANVLIGSDSGTVTTAAVGNVTEVKVAPNADVTKTSIGHISVQYALVDLLKVSHALHGHHTEMGVDRFIRLANEEALDNAVEFVERTDHWGFRDGVQSWAGTNGAVTQSTVFTSSQDSDTSGVWSFTVSGTPTFNNYFILTTAQSASVSPGDRVTISTYPSLTFRVTSLSAPFGGFVNCYVTPDAAAPIATAAVASSGAHSLLLTANGGGQPFAFSPGGTSGIPVNPGDIISAGVEVMAPTALPNAYISIKTFNAAGTGLTETASTDLALVANAETTMTVTKTADPTAAFFNIHVGDHNADANNTLMYLDNVRVHPRMGPQTRKEYHRFLEEIKDLDQGILKEARDLHGMRYRTRFRLLNQTPAVTLNYATQQLAVEVPEPVLDEQNLHDDIIVKRRKGSASRATGGSGGPPGSGRPTHKHVVKVAAERDEQLINLANHLLTIGTTTDERFPLIAVHMQRSEVANIMSALAGVEVGDYIQLTNLPFWYPSATAKQLVTGYSEMITPFEWTITWNAVPESPLEIITTPPRW